MDTSTPQDGAWARGDRYENHVGRWSRLLAPLFVQWLSMPRRAAWLDVGCGTGALARAILEGSDPRSVKALDRSPEYVAFARSQLSDVRVSFDVADAQDLRVKPEAYDAAVSGLVLNFVENHARMISEMKRAVCQGGAVALYVWDYAGRMQFMRHLWDAAAALDPAARELDEGRRFPICTPDALRRLFEESGLSQVEIMSIEIDTHFRDFDDFWNPFLGGEGPASAYVMSLSEAARDRLRERLQASLPFALDGSIPLVARAWAVKGIK